MMKLTYPQRNNLLEGTPSARIMSDHWPPDEFLRILHRVPIQDFRLTLPWQSSNLAPLREIMTNNDVERGIPMTKAELGFQAGRRLKGYQEIRQRDVEFPRCLDKRKSQERG